MRPLILFLFALPLVGTGCEPGCEQTCKKLLECEDVDTDRLALTECESSCKIRQQVYDDWDDKGRGDRFADSKRCIMDEACEGIAAGVCYDDALFIW